LGKALIAAVVAVVCFGALALVVRSNLKHPELKPPEVANSTTTGQAARSAGAQVLPTEPKPSISPTPAGPPPVQPSNPN
jgi:hypothetical protein